MFFCTKRKAIGKLGVCLFVILSCIEIEASYRGFLDFHRDFRALIERVRIDSIRTDGNEARLSEVVHYDVLKDQYVINVLDPSRFYSSHTAVTGRNKGREQLRTFPYLLEDTPREILGIWDDPNTNTRIAPGATRLNRGVESLESISGVPIYVRFYTADQLDDAQFQVLRHLRMWPPRFPWGSKKDSERNIIIHDVNSHLIPFIGMTKDQALKISIISGVLHDMGLEYYKIGRLNDFMPVIDFWLDHVDFGTADLESTIGRILNDRYVKDRILTKSVAEIAGITYFQPSTYSFAKVCRGGCDFKELEDRLKRAFDGFDIRKSSTSTDTAYDVLQKIELINSRIRAIN